jgi:hypothetical protein
VNISSQGRDTAFELRRIVVYEPVGPEERAARQETGRWIEPEDTTGLNGYCYRSEASA